METSSQGPSEHRIGPITDTSRFDGDAPATASDFSPRSISGRPCCPGFETLGTNGMKNVTGGGSIRAGFGGGRKKKRQEAELEVDQIKMLSLSLGATGMDWIRSEDIRGTARVKCFGDKGGPRWVFLGGSCTGER